MKSIECLEIRNDAAGTTTVNFQAEKDFFWETPSAKYLPKVPNNIKEHQKGKETAALAYTHEP